MASAAAVAELQMRSSVDAALAAVRQVLDATRTPQYAADVPHAYNDKCVQVTATDRVTLLSLFGSRFLHVYHLITCIAHTQSLRPDFHACAY